MIFPQRWQFIAINPLTVHIGKKLREIAPFAPSQDFCINETPKVYYNNVSILVYLINKLNV